MQKYHRQHTAASEPIPENPSIWSAWLVRVPALHTLMDTSACEAAWSLAALQDCSFSKNTLQNSVWLGLTTGFGLELSSNAPNNSTWDTLADHHHWCWGGLSESRLRLPGLTTQKSEWSRTGEMDERGGGQRESGHRNGLVRAGRALRKRFSKQARTSSWWKTTPPPTKYSCQKIKQQFYQASTVSYLFTGNVEDKRTS